MKKFVRQTAVTAGVVSMLTLAACGDEATETEESDDSGEDTAEETEDDDDEEDDGDDDDEEGTEVDEDEEVDVDDVDEDEVVSLDDFDQVREADESEVLEDGSLTAAIVSDSPFEGTLNWNFYHGTHDAQILSWFDEALLSWGDDFVYNQEGAATYEVSDDNLTYTFEIHEDVNWHDGEPVTAEDWEFAYEVIADPEYTGVRFGEDIMNVEGVMEYHEGEADEISGIEVIDDKTLEITFIEANPSIVTGGIWSYPLAKHIFEDMPVDEIESSSEVREEPIGFGPYVVEDIVPGESIQMSRNEDYWRGTPALEEATLQVVGPNVVANSLESGDVDYVESFPADQVVDTMDAENLEFLGVTDRAYTYIGFKLGEWDAEAGENVMNEDAKMADPALRQAMGKALDDEAVGENFYDGLRWDGTTLIPPSHPEFHNDEIEGHGYDPEEANALLDEAGYEDVTGDGFREDPDGDELVITFASMEGGDTAEPIAQYYMQAWEEVGLNVELLDGRLHEFNAFYDMVEEDDEDIDIYQGAWTVGIDVDPDSLYGRTSPANYSRYVSEENDELIERGLSDEAFDVEYREEVYNEWQEYMVEQTPVYPTVYRADIDAMNERVVNTAIGDGTGVYRYEIGVTEEEPVTN
ncbi:peptide/nickel transport system substrate-binding protein [Salsuginibacillus halophilus]|uniref:Peptide/nickel transport system substrate-binding protein n=1 Tax=Salsuginibacillus halophilus TaxID=517424 RepID=A0A2P8HI28_9BACI|nr:oligopeptide ABC transporter substrate-binding protein [Salsuginibacillus halophilus]PSL45882.1 peptide/nickel transport system substrate-binding protein [Salsuginibacillus halophilus]